MTLHVVTLDSINQYQTVPKIGRIGGYPKIPKYQGGKYPRKQTSRKFKEKAKISKLGAKTFEKNGCAEKEKEKGGKGKERERRESQKLSQPKIPSVALIVL